jgi:hypothetical protein
LLQFALLKEGILRACGGNATDITASSLCIARFFIVDPPIGVLSDFSDELLKIQTLFRGLVEILSRLD